MSCKSTSSLYAMSESPHEIRIVKSSSDISDKLWLLYKKLLPSHTLKGLEVYMTRKMHIYIFCYEYLIFSSFSNV